MSSCSYARLQVTVGRVQRLFQRVAVEAMGQERGRASAAWTVVFRKRTSHSGLVACDSFL